MKPIWFTLGFFSLGLGIIGVALPVLPTTPFIILAAFCFAKSSQKFHDRLINHKIFGPLITEWDKYGAIRPSAKILAVTMMAAVLGGSYLFDLPTYALVIQGGVLLCAAIFILTRPDGPAG